MWEYVRSQMIITEHKGTVINILRETVMTQAINHQPVTTEAKIESVSGYYVWDLWWTKWQWGKFSYEYVGFVPVLFYHCTIFISHSGI
jgi:hypothetical protein